MDDAEKIARQAEARIWREAAELFDEYATRHQQDAHWCRARAAELEKESEGRE